MKKLFDDLLRSGSGKSSIVFNMMLISFNSVIMTDVMIIAAIYMMINKIPIDSNIYTISFAALFGSPAYATTMKVKQNKESMQSKKEGE